MGRPHLLPHLRSAPACRQRACPGAVELPDWLKQPVLGAAEQIEDVYYRDLHQNEKTKGGFWYLAGRIFEACKLTRASRST
jgi:hypothetical protein